MRPLRLLALVAVLAGAVIAGVPNALALPPGFSREIVARGLNVPTAFAFLPGNRILVAEKSGIVRLVKNGALQSSPFIDLRSRVHNYSDHGLLGITPDPNFLANGYVYLYYMYDDTRSSPDSAAGLGTARLVRVTASGDTASPASEVILVGNVPANFGEHTGGNVRFAADGTIFLSTGDAATPARVSSDSLRAQDIDSLAGKLIRVAPNGQGLPSNPFWNGDPNANRSKVWAYGLRNAFRVNLRPGSGMPYVGDVGWTSWEEIDAAARGANLGWPCYEGPSRQSGFDAFDVCKQLSPSSVRFPVHAYPARAGATPGRGSSVTGGAFATGTAYPPPYQGSYFFGDYVFGWIRYLQVDQNDNRVAGPSDFETAADGPVDIEMGPEGFLYYLSINTGQLRRVRFTTGNVPPTAVASASPTNGLAPLRVQFSSAGSGDADGQLQRYSWSFGDGGTSTVANPQHTYTRNGRFTAKLTVTDNRGGTGSASVTITVGNRAPIATITTPASSFRYKVGDTVAYSGSARDLDPGDRVVSLSWQVTLKHCPGGSCHDHPWGATSGANGTLSVPDHGDDTHFELVLNATDNNGLTGTASVAVHPQAVNITLGTSPSGLQVVYDGTAVTAPFSRPTIVGSTHTIFAPSPQGAATFAGWSDGGAQQHTVTLGAADATYVANFNVPGGGPPGSRGPLGGGAVTITGTSKRNVLIGGPANEIVRALGGNDRIFAMGGNDIVYAGRGNDIAYGHTGDDALYGDPGNDRLYGGAGNDRLYGGTGRDRLVGAAGADVVSARGGGRDRVDCGPGRDLVRADRLDRVAKNCELVRRR